jgi:hypothetical protein
VRAGAYLDGIDGSQAPSLRGEGHRDTRRPGPLPGAARRLVPDDRVVCPDERHGSGPATAAARHGHVPI